MDESVPYEKLLAHLSTCGVKYLVCGGVAVGLRGYIRITEDIDIVVDHDPENVRRLALALKGFGEGHGGELSPADFPLEPGAVQIHDGGITLDVFTVIDGASYGELVADSSEVELPPAGQRVPCLSRKQLIAIKARTFREKDRLDFLALSELERREREIGGGN